MQRRTRLLQSQLRHVRGAGHCLLDDALPLGPRMVNSLALAIIDRVGHSRALSGRQAVSLRGHAPWARRRGKLEAQQLATTSGIDCGCSASCDDFVSSFREARILL
jgi:hypothetical protein